MNELDRRPFRALVVDDEEIVVSLVKDALEDDGLMIESAGSGEEALALCRNFDCQLLITDIRMPGMDGIKLAARVREMYPDALVVFMTGYANLNSAKDAIKQGAFDYIMKPFELTEIRQTVRKAIAAIKEAAHKTQESTLSHLSDLNRMLFTANDRDSLVASSLRFAMMHQQADHGAIMMRGDSTNQSLLFEISDDRIERRECATANRTCLIDLVDSTILQEPMLLGSLNDLPFRDNTGRLPDNVTLARWMHDLSSAVVVPIRRKGELSALVFLGFADDSITVREADLSFLAITASQLGISLENISLLEETQAAYAKLKELQDETIELEKMATRGQLSAEIGHELNNFLGVVAGNLSLLDFNLKKGDLSKLERYVATMTETVDKMKRFTGNLMDLRTISSTREVVQFDQMIAEVIDYLKPQKRFKDVSIVVEHLDENIPFEADTTQIQQLLYNLFNNAADATQDSASRRITVGVTRLETEQAFEIVIKDTGSGFPEEVIQKAFNSQFTTKPTGHGFGLVVCGRIIRNHGGEVTVASTPGSGSTIAIRLPLAVGQPVPA
jgi:signal transduction histidine kinase/CheY-like chemotaxis protein